MDVSTVNLLRSYDWNPNQCLESRHVAWVNDKLMMIILRMEDGSLYLFTGPEYSSCPGRIPLTEQELVDILPDLASHFS